MKAIIEFSKLSKEQKSDLLKKYASYIDEYSDNENTVYVYSLFNFFVELTSKGRVVLEILPYERGFRKDLKYTINSLAA